MAEQSEGPPVRLRSAAADDAGEIARVRRGGHRRAWLAVAAGNESARRFYEHAGWVDDGPIVHRAPVPGGSVEVACHRFFSPTDESRARPMSRGPDR